MENNMMNTVFDRLILGEDYVCSTDSAVTGLNNNIIVVGSSGGGKTMSIMEPRLLETYNSNLVVTVTKRRIVQKYRPMFENRGYTVMDMNFVKPRQSDICYDPMAYVRSYQDITFLARAIVLANPRKENSSADPYWDDAAISLLSAEISYVMMTHKGANFVDVLKYHDALEIEEDGSQITTNHDEDFDNLNKQHPNCFAYNCWRSFHSVPIKTASCIFGTLNSTIDSIFTPELREMIARNKSVKFSQLASTKSVLFITSSAVNPALNCFINMFYAQMFKSLFEYGESQPDGRLPIPVAVLCDDFATGSRILNFPEYISIFREKGISVTLLVQSESQLNSMYGTDNATTIINNCDTYIYLGGMDLSTGRTISQRLNLPLDEVLYMPVGQEVIFRRGTRPKITSRYDILHDPNYISVTEQYEAGATR